MPIRIVSQVVTGTGGRPKVSHLLISQKVKAERGSGVYRFVGMSSPSDLITWSGLLKF
jgi:hypothetical protein